RIRTSKPTSRSCTPISGCEAKPPGKGKNGRETMRLSTGLMATATAVLLATPALAVDVKIGVLNDRSGVYADLSGEGSVVAARMAVEDFDAAAKDINVEIVSADHQNKPDVASNVARQWYDQ